jgi:hypothetical protein
MTFSTSCIKAQKQHYSTQEARKTFSSQQIIDINIIRNRVLFVLHVAQIQTPSAPRPLYRTAMILNAIPESNYQGLAQQGAASHFLLQMFILEYLDVEILL